MAKYSELYPDAQDGFFTPPHNDLPGVEKYVCKDVGCKSDHKCICGEKTTWINNAAPAYVCSTECDERIWKGLILTFIASQILGGRK